jgi:hypothetical protein
VGCGSNFQSKLHPKLSKGETRTPSLTFTTTHPSSRSVTSTTTTTINMSNQNPMQDYLRRIQGQIQRSGGRGGFGGGMPPGRIGAGVGGLILLGGGIWAAQHALFNVDGGHRAIKYRRTTGVSKEIYSEGMFSTPATRRGKQDGYVTIH